MAGHPGVFVIIQAGPAQGFVIEGKTQGFHQVKIGASVGAQADDVARVGRDFGLEQDDGEHLSGLLKWRKFIDLKMPFNSVN